MFNVERITTPAAPLTAAEVRAHLRLNDTSEDALLDEFIDAAVARFEDETKRPVLTATFRQYLARWPQAIVLGRGGVTAVSSISRVISDSVIELLSGYVVDLNTTPARVTLKAVPNLVVTADGVTRTPCGYVEFTAGWANAAAVPRDVRTALKLLAGHFYANREAYRDSAFEMRELPAGFASVCDKYRLGLTGPWGQQ